MDSPDIEIEGNNNKNLEDSPLLSTGTGESYSATAGTERATVSVKPLGNFVGLCCCFGISHASITVAMAYASTVFEMRLGSISIGVICFTYTISALCFAVPIVDSIGVKRTMELSLASFVLYLMFYCLGTSLTVARGHHEHEAQWASVILGSFFCGFAIGVGWVAQGVYYSLAAKKYQFEQVVYCYEVRSGFASFIIDTCILF